MTQQLRPIWTTSLPRCTRRSTFCHIGLLSEYTRLLIYICAIILLKSGFQCLGCMAYRFRWGYSAGDRKQRRLPRSGGRSAAEAIFFQRDRFDLVTTRTFLDDLITQEYSPTAPSILVFLG